MNTLVLALLAGIGWGISDVLVRIAGEKGNPIVANILVATGMLIAGIVFAIISQKVTAFDMSAVFKTKSVWILLFAGAIHATAFFFFIHFFQSGGTLTQGPAIINTVITLITVGVGIILFADPFSWRIAAGVVCAMFAIYLLK